MARRNKARRLKVNSHVDCVILWLAVRQHCDDMTDQYQAAVDRCCREGDETGKRLAMRCRDEVYNCGRRTLRRLERMQKAFEAEAEMEPLSCGGGDYNGCAGDVAARDTY
jgi:hypothetical protein